MFRLRFLGKLIMLLLIVSLAQAQESLFQQGNKQLDARSYAKAISIYEQALEENKLSDAQRHQVTANMGYAYYELGDNPRAENYYKTFFGDGQPVSESQKIHYLNYAKVLGSNGKTKESEQMLALYENTKKQNQTSAQMPKGKINYKVEYLAINSSESEFSPVFYRDGLVYVAGKTAAVSSESLKQGNMDLMYMSNRNDIRSLTATNADGSESKISSKATGRNVEEPYRRLGKDSYTKPTSNDSKTVGRFDTYGMDFEDGGTKITSNGKPGKPSSFSKSLNTKYHEGPATFSADGSQIIFTRNNFNAGQKGQSLENDVKLKLYSAQWGGNDWTEAEELPFNSDEYSTAHPSLSKDGTHLYFVSDMPGGVGGKDLYVSIKNNTTWGKPINLGREVNSRNDELFPFIDDSGNLYFSTTGRRGNLGGLDICYAVLNRDGTKIIDIVALDAPINSSGDDFGIVTNSDRSIGYFSSDRQNGDDDIYRFTRESSLYDCRELTLKVYDSEGLMSLDSAKIIVKTRGSADVSKELYTDENGRAHLCLLADNDFMFTAEKSGYLNSTIGFSTRGLTDDKPTRLEMSLTKPTIILDTIETQGETPRGSLPTENTGPTSIKPQKKGKSTSQKQNTDDGWGQVSIANQKAQEVLEGEVLEEIDAKPIEGAVAKLISGCTGEAVQTVVSGKDGKYKFIIKDFSCSYSVVITKKSYSTFVKKIGKLSKKPTQKIMAKDIVTMLKEGDMIRVDNINFENSKFNILPDAAIELNKLAGTISKYPTAKFEILSHTDSRGDADANKALAQKRAQKIADYLVSKGIAKTRMKATGVGESQPLNGCVDGVICTEGEYQRNRRIEFKVLSAN